MKKNLLLILALLLAMGSFGQFKSSMIKNRPVAPALHVTTFDLQNVVGQAISNNIVTNKSIMDDPVSSITRYDQQTNDAIDRRIFLYPDGTIGTAATWSQQDASFTDRGTGYNYWDGSAFGPLPDARIETVRTGWPCYFPLGAGEFVVSHEAAGNLVLNSRPVKGTGAWTQKILPNTVPSGVPVMLWPRACTNGANRMNIHLLALTEPVGNGGAIYNGLDGALMYCRSLDGGVTFSAWSQIPGLTSTDYTFFAGDSYAFAEPKGDTIAFTVGGDVMDLLLMKSVDNGTTWTKTVIWHSLYNLGGTSPSFYNACNGSQAVVLDNAGFAHVACGYAQDSAYNASNHYYSRTANGIVYWNEHMGQLPQLLDPDTLTKHHQIGGWLKDTSVFSFPLANLTVWGGGLTNYPQLVIDKKDKIFLIYGGATTLVDPNGNNFHHIFGRDGTLSGDTVYWSNDTIVDITGDFLTYSFSDCVYASAAPTTEDNYVYLLYQKDDYAGSFIQAQTPGQASASDNSISLLKWTKPINVGVTEKHEKPSFSVTQNYPNPVNGLTRVNVYLQNSGSLSLKVTNLTGQTLMNMEKSNAQAGVNQFVIDGTQLSSGVYFYTVKQGDKSITKKMIVQ